MSYAQDMLSMGAVEPRVMREAFQVVLRAKGEALQLWHKPQSINCPCWDEIYNSADADCEVCNGTGKISGFSAEPDAAFIAAIFLDPEVRQDKHQELMTRTGRVQTMDGVMFCEGRWYDTIKVGDVILYKPRGRVTGVELRVISKLPRSANNGEVIFVMCNLEKQPTPEVYGSSVQETI